jgi:hypothetical protein
MQKNPKDYLVNELYEYTVITLVAGTFFGFFYGIFLYKNTFNIKILLLDLLISSVAALIGYFFGTYVTHQKGYLITLRFSLLLASLAALFAYLKASEIALIFGYIAIIKGASAGIYASVFDIYLLRELNQRQKGRYLYLNLSIEFIVTTITPVLVGGLLSFGGSYQLTFLIASILYFGAVWLPKQYNKKPKCNLSLKDALAITKKPHFLEFGSNLIVGSGADQLNVFMITIIPYLILKNEFGVGVLAGLAAIVAAVTAYYLKNVKGESQHKVGYAGGIGRFVGNIFLAFYWTTPVLVIRGLFNNVFAVFYDPAFRKAQIGNAEMILGKDINNQALELVFLEAILAFIGKFGAVLIFLTILASESGSQSTIIRWLLLVYAVWKIADYAWVLSMKKRFSQPAIENSKAPEFAESLN